MANEEGTSTRTKDIVVPILVALGAGLISFALEELVPELLPRDAEAVRHLLPHLSGLFKFASYLALSYILAVELLERVCFPAIREIGKNALVPQLELLWTEMRVSLVAAIREKKISVGSVDYEEKAEQRRAHPVLKSVADAAQEDELLKPVQSLIALDRFRIAVAKLDELVLVNEKKYVPHLLSVLIMSQDRAYWERAEKLIANHGAPMHFQRLAFAFWTDKKLDQAIKCTTEGLQCCAKLGITDEEVIGKLKNSLAYYYADALRIDRKQECLEFASAECKRRKAKDPTSIGYADALDTLGYVKISLGDTTDEVLDGMKDCTLANAVCKLDLYEVHLQRARERLEHIAAASRMSREAT